MGRIDDLRKIRGVLFSPKTVEEIIRKEFQEVEEFEIVVERRGLMDMIMLRAEVAPTLPLDAIAKVRDRLKESLKIGTNLSFHVIIEPPCSLPRYQLKAKRFKDMREGEKDA
jgi:phenylacetate-CoA ligase